MQHCLLGLLAHTSLHTGLGKSTGVIDLPIMREAHTQWPCIFGSAMKGALRAKAVQVKLPLLKEIFGPDTSNASEHAGALTVGDARLLLLPVRSLTGHFKWVTCPALLQRASADAKRLQAPAAPRLADDVASHANDAVVLVPRSSQSASPRDKPAAPSKNTLFLEEFSLTVQEADLVDWVSWLEAFGGSDLTDRLKAQLAIVSNDLFAHLAKFATPVNMHIAIDNERKTVKAGALWSEETLPPETVLYVALASHAARARGAQHSATQMLERAMKLFDDKNRPYLQVGGNETVGMGWVKVTPVTPGQDG